MPQNLLPQFSATLRATPKFDVSSADARHPLCLGGANVSGKQVRMIYAPFDHVNLLARIAIVGMTPGAFQANNALAAARSALLAGHTVDDAGQLAKLHASFSGEPMRGNLVRMMDSIGLARFLGLVSTASLWAADSSLVHFTSALRYPVFVDGDNWSGTPDMVRTPLLREWLVNYTGAELGVMPSAIIVPLGAKVCSAMHHLADVGLIDRCRILDGLPHPSGANAERIAYFLGDKAAHLCSSKTNTTKLDEARAELCARVSRL